MTSTTLNSAVALPHRIFVFDFVCALTVGVAYLLLFNFMTDTLELPRWVVTTQLIANFTYGFYGAFLFFRRVTRSFYFQFLIVMNFAYASLCLLIAAELLVSSHAHGSGLIPLGAYLLLIEALFIAALATLESSVRGATKRLAS